MSLRQTDTAVEGSSLENKVKTNLAGAASSGKAQGTWTESSQQGDFRMTILPAGGCTSMHFEKERDGIWQTYTFRRSDTPGDAEPENSDANPTNPKPDDSVEPTLVR